MAPTRNAGQSSLEFLMTYGWGILIIIIVSVVAWQLGIFDVRGATRPGAVGFWGVIPTDFIYQSDGDFFISIRNTVGGNISIESFNVSSGEIYCNKEYTSILEDLPAGSNVTLEIIDEGSGACLPAGLKPGSQFETYVSITYEDRRLGREMTSSGIIWGSVES